MADDFATSSVPAPRRRRWGSVVMVVIAILAGAGFLYWLTHRPPAEDASGFGGGAGGGGGGRGGPGGGRRPPTTVGIFKVIQADVPLTVDALGTVTPPVTATVRTRIAGTLDKVLFSEGQEVRAGQLLAEVDPRPYKLALDQAQGALARDVAQQKQARADLNRYQTLLQQDSIARQQVDTQSALVGQLGGTIATDQAAVGVAKLNLAYTRITAPVSGRVGLRQVDVGNYVTTGDANGIVVVTQVHPIDVVFTLPEAQLPRVAAGARKGKLPVTAFDRGGGTVLAQGQFSTFDNRVDVATGTVSAKARFSNADSTLFPNQFVNIRLTYDTLQNVTVVPTTAIRNGPQGTFVYVVKPDRTAELRVVKTGAAAGDQVAVLTGLKVGETVVTEGADRLTDGGKVVLPGDKPSFGAGRGRGRGAGAGADAGGSGAEGGQRRHRRDGAGAGAAPAAAPAAQ
ncbi:MdtA/MuxA family multidrug efflux RND transporter periplasmic adaptor subunit [Glacieibacterium sp.]|uniref:MdtA/MuxA family multidrug efflux RND transporter periplasmic adaptor subunit n=1 Tax=Glacieibacterium sp. TaxID=2860237 RepID=UPI003B00C9D6